MRFISFIFTVFIAVSGFGCINMEKEMMQWHYHGIIPAPHKITVTDSSRSSLSTLVIKLPDNFDPAFIKSISSDLNSLEFTNHFQKANVIINQTDSLSSESYRIVIEKEKINIYYSQNPGLQYALTSLIQMIRFSGLPLKICTLEDSPAFSYRGMHLDVVRHFFSVEEVKKYLDFMAYYKFNHFHWHLTDDQGWRIEIKKFPKLQEVGSWRDETLIGHYNDEPHRFDGKKYGGYYTQEQIKEVVNYAASRNITVVPEIEMPGHALAALASYPELGCGPGPYKVATYWGVFNDVFCPKENTFAFLEAVIDEVVQLFPGKYIHIGGDECPKEAWKNSDFCQKLMKEKGLKDEYSLQSYFISRMEKYINSKGKQIIGWDEILEGGIAPNATVMSWRGIEGGLEAARANHNIIMTPGSHCYFDHYQSEPGDEPLAIGGFTPIDKVYHWNPIPDELEQEKRVYILGGQANVWTEYIPDFSKVEYMAFARGIAMAEALWGSNKDYLDFQQRFELHYSYLHNKGVNVAYHLLNIKPEFRAGDGRPIRVKFSIPQGAWLEYTINGQEVKAAESDEEIIIDRSVNYSFQAIKGDRKGKKISFDFILHQGTEALIHLDPLPSRKYFGNGPASLINGIRGSDDTYAGTEWLGFEGTDAIVTLDFKTTRELNQVLLRFFKAEGQWIYLPPLIELLTSQDGIHFSKYTSISNIGAYEKIGDILFNLGNLKTRYLRVHAHNYGVIPEGKQGAGHRAWLFMDEITVQ